MQLLKILFSNILVSLLVFTNGLMSQTRPRTFLIDPSVVTTVRQAIQNGSKDYAEALESLCKDADKALKTAAVSVMDKNQVPPSGDKHDYMSMGKYWWPDSSKPNGLPYIRRDGEANPEVKKLTDHDHLLKMIDAVSTLSLAYYYSGKESYAEHAARLLRTWFLDSLTRMNPNLNYAQAIPGITDGRGIGIIDARPFCELVDAFGLLSESAQWTQQDRKGIFEWFSQYFHWLQESTNGKDEAATKNNHGTWYDVQVVSIALYLGDEKIAKSVLETSREKRIAMQVEPDGTQPEELARTRSLGYSMLNLHGLVSLAVLGERVGVDLWHFETADGRSIRKAMDYMLPYFAGEKKWDRLQITDDWQRLTEMYWLLFHATEVYHDQKYVQAALKIPRVKEYVARAALKIGNASF
jgi:hypothetical protein